jgi:hypothetical protein
MSHNTDSKSPPSIRNIPRLADEILRHYETLDYGLQTVRGATQELKSTSKSLKGRGNVGKRISAVGLTLIVCPEPFTSIVGVPMLVLGGILTHRSSLALKDIRNETDFIIKTLKEAKNLT